MNSKVKKIILIFIFISMLLPAYADGSSQRNPESQGSSDFSRQLLNLLLESPKTNDPVYDQSMLTPGSAIYVDNYFAGLNTYQHYGVYTGNGNVIHFAPLEGQEISYENGVIHETTLEKFLGGRTLKIDTNIVKSFSEQEIIQRAKSRLGEKEYDLIFNNCEHFTRWCITGESRSYQVLNFPEKLENAILIIREELNSISRFLDSIK